MLSSFHILDRTIVKQLVEIDTFARMQVCNFLKIIIIHFLFISGR